MTHKLNSEGTVAVSQDTFWLPIDTCPKHVKVLVYPKTGSARIDKYTGQTDILGWFPMPRKPYWLKTKETEIIASFN